MQHCQGEAPDVGTPIAQVGVINRSLSKRVLVTSGAGFLGSHLCGQLLNQGCGVLCVNNFTYP